MREKESRFADFYKEDGKQVKERKIEIKPNTGRAVGLGIYSKSDPEPDFELTFSPDMADEMGVSPGNTDVPHEPDKRLVIYMFHNYGSKPCTITLRRVERLNNGRH